MYTSLSIQGFRCFESFRLEGLKRVNLLVGRNNSGKTAVLEAVELLTAPDADTPWKIAARRQELVGSTPTVQSLFRGYDLRGGHVLLAGRLPGRNDEAWIELRVPAEKGPFSIQFGTWVPNRLDIGRPDDGATMPMGEGGELLPFGSKAGRDLVTGAPEKVAFLGTSSLDAEGVVGRLSAILLTPEEDLVRDGLRIVEPRVDRLAVELFDKGTRSRGGVRLLLRGDSQPRSIVSLGEGTWRVLGLILSLISMKGGYLLVDEIDTGLHHTVLPDIWRVLIQTARRLDVQVFATTHSDDCRKALAQVVEELNADDVSLQRIERDKDTAIHYTAEDVVAAARHDIEVR